MDKWKSRLSGFEINLIETVASDLLEEFDYPLIGRPVNLNKLQKMYFNLHQKILGDIELQYQLKKLCSKTFLTEINHL